MAGITGVYCLDGSEVNKHLIKKMTDTIVHRGPFGESFYFNKNIGLGCRLQGNTGIPEKSQLLASEDNSLIIVYDGHIYNSCEIRKELERTGYRFHTYTDTEVILQSYKQWGENCLNRFNGMWALAIWDTQSGRLFCARDRFGLKPFYYYFNRKVFVFASEIKAILDYPLYHKQVNEEAIYSYLMWGMFDNEDTFFKDIKELGPSHFLLLDIEQGLRSKDWWKFDFNCSTTKLSEADTDYSIEHFRSLLEDAVKLRIEPEEPVGITLSGGLDSSVIAALASRFIHDSSKNCNDYIGAKLKALSSRYDDKTADEGVFIEIAAQGMELERIDVFSNGYDLWEEFPKFMWHYDEPCAPGSIYPRWNLMKKAKELGLKVILDGDGADVLMAGHYRYHGNFIVELACKCETAKLLSEVIKASSIIGLRQLGLSVGQVLVGMLYSKFSLYLPLMLRNFRLRLRHRITDKILVPSFDKKFYKYGLERINEEYNGHSKCLQQRLYRDLLTLSPYIRYSERGSAAFSIETRSPFLDYRLVEYAFTLPANLKINNGWTKWILRESMLGILPEQIRLRKEKLGFPSPLRTWLLLNKENINKLFGTGNVLSSQYIKVKDVKDNFDELISYEYSARELWRYINLELWLQIFFDRRS